MGKTFRQLTDEVREINTALGWRLGDSTLGDLVALVHTEVAEATTAYRRYRLADMTRPACGRAVVSGESCPEHGLPKPAGVADELADVVIRLIDLADIFQIRVFEPDLELADVAPIHMSTVTWPEPIDTFGEYMDWLHSCVHGVVASRDVPRAIRAVATVANQFGIDLAMAVERKVAYNRTREYQHGGTMSDAKPKTTEGMTA